MAGSIRPSTSTWSSRTPGRGRSTRFTVPARSLIIAANRSPLSSARMHPLERLVNLVALLLEARRPLTFEEIRADLPAYQQEDKATAKRQFERDKDTLRAIGIPVEVAPTDVWEVEEGYRIPRERYELPEVEFTAEEAAALFVAAHAGVGGEAAQAFRKLALGVDTGVLAGLAERGGSLGGDPAAPRGVPGLRAHPGGAVGPGGAGDHRPGGVQPQGGLVGAVRAPERPDPQDAARRLGRGGGPRGGRGLLRVLGAVLRSPRPGPVPSDLPGRRGGAPGGR